jgi:hypothetical protein
MAEEKKGAVQAAEEERGSIAGRSGDDGRPRTRDSHLCPLIIRDGSGSGLERISADFGYMVVGLVQIFTHGFADLDIRNNVGLGRILHFACGYPLELRKIDPNKPT